MTWQEFEQLPNEKIEIVEGTLITLPLPQARHSIIAANTLESLQPIEATGFGLVLGRAAYKLTEDPATLIQPDISFLKMERVRATPPNSYFLGAPELAVEIVSPSETAEELNRKIELLLRHGSLVVWVMYSVNREVRVFLPDGTSFKRGINDVLILPELLPGWELPVARLFE